MRDMTFNCDLGESGAPSCMGQIRSRQVLEKLLAVEAQENARLFLVWMTIVQRMKLQDVCNLIGKNHRCVLRAPSKLLLKINFS